MNSLARTAAAAAGVLLLACADCGAQGLSDPTRPPPAFGSAGAADAGAETSSLQSIIRSSRGKPAAIINGEYVVLGGRVGEARLVKISDDSVTLKTPTGSETLMLVPGVEKTPAAPAGQEQKMRKDRNEGKR